MSGDTDQVSILRLDGAQDTSIEDSVVVEEPLEIRVGGESMVVTMRTPGDDLDLAAGFMLTEGWIRSIDDVGTLAYCPDERDPGLRNTVDVRLLREGPVAPARRATWANSSCGLCGKATLDSIRLETKALETSVRITREVVLGLPDALSAEQRNFRLTGGIHAAGLFDRDGDRKSTRLNSSH